LLKTHSVGDEEQTRDFLDDAFKQVRKSAPLFEGI
jgi:hypothetical protein